MSRPSAASARNDALLRARDHSPFLRDAIAALPELTNAFLDSGSEAAVELAAATARDGVESRLRGQRLGLALSVALGDLASELSLEKVTGFLSDFADRAIDEALHAAVAERVPGAEPNGFAIIAMGKLGSHELNYSSDVDLIFLCDPETLPRRSLTCLRTGSRTRSSSTRASGSTTAPR